MAASHYRARTGTELIDASFQLVKSHYAQLVSIAALGLLPALVGQMLNPAFNPTSSTRPTIGASYFVLMILNVISYTIMQGALIQASAEAYHGRPIDLGTAIQTGLRRGWRIFLANLMIGFVVGFGFLLLIVPGFIFFAWFFLTPAVIVLESRGIGEAASRSRDLCKDHKLRILGLTLAFFLLFLVVYAAAGIVAAIVARQIPFIMAFIIIGIQALLWPVYPAMMTLQYYDTRIRKEGYDVELLANDVAPSTSPTPATA